MRDQFKIEIAERKKINKIGSEIKYFGLFFFAIFSLVLVPARYLPFEISFSLILFGEWLHGMGKYTNAKLEFHPDSILLISGSRNIEIKHFNIKKITGWKNFTHRYKKPNVLIKTKTKERYEIRIDIEIFDILTDTFPNKKN